MDKVWKTCGGNEEGMWKTCLGKQEEDVRSTHGGQQASKEGKGWGDKIRWEIVTSGMFFSLYIYTILMSV